MKKSSTFFKKLSGACSIFAILLVSSCRKEGFDISLTKEFQIQATANGANYHIKVGLPANYNASNGKYATVYVLDGEENFDFVSNECKRISERYGTQNVIVVSIGYGNDRSVDYTPTKVSNITGGGPLFLNFIETQLIPEIEQSFRAETSRNSRVILGHSYGGLFAGYVYCVNNKLFGNYLLLSPSFWFDDMVSLQLEKNNRPINKDERQLVFLGVGEAENYGRMQAPLVSFYQSLVEKYTSIKLAKNVVKDLDHLGSKNPNIILGLDYYFQNR